MKTDKRNTREGFKPQKGGVKKNAKGLNKSSKHAPTRRPEAAAKAGKNHKRGSDKPVNFVVNPRQLKHQMLEAEKSQKREAFRQQKEEKAKKFNEFQKRKFERNKVLGQKTRRGQPVMKGRMEMLLNQIQYKLSKE